MGTRSVTFNLPPVVWRVHKNMSKVFGQLRNWRLALGFRFYLFSPGLEGEYEQDVCFD